MIVTAPNPPGSRQLISPPAAVFEIAPANVLHGAVRLHGLTSSPTPETQVRVAWALAGVAANAASAMKTTASMRIGTSLNMITPLFEWEACSRLRATTQSPPSSRALRRPCRAVRAPNYG